MKRSGQTEKRHLLFVYGTLKRGQPNHHFLAGALFLGEDQTRPEFTMYDLGAFPGVVAGGSSSISGELYELDDSTLARVDRLEGHPSFYERTSNILVSGRTCWIYLLADHQWQVRRTRSFGNRRRAPEASWPSTPPSPAS